MFLFFNIYCMKYIKMFNEELGGYESSNTSKNSGYPSYLLVSEANKLVSVIHRMKVSDEEKLQMLKDLQSVFTQEINQMESGL